MDTNELSEICNVVIPILELISFELYVLFKDCILVLKTARFNKSLLFIILPKVPK